MNELIFIVQTAAIVGALFWALKIGKEAVVTLCVLFSVLANFFVLKQMVLFGWNVTCSDAFAIGNIFGLNLLQQVFGKEAAKKTIWISFFGVVFFAVASQVHLAYIPSLYDTSHDHFSALLGWTPRLLFASLMTFFIVQQIDVKMFSFLQKRFAKISWQNRIMLCLFLSQALDTALFSLLGLYGIIQELGAMMIVSYLVKCTVIVLITAGSRIFDPLKKLTERAPDEV